MPYTAQCYRPNAERGTTEVTTTEATPGGPRALASPDRLHFPDLAATVHVDHVPGGLADELPGLYSSLYSTLDWFLTHCLDWFLTQGRPPNGACVLEEPRHVLLFDHNGGTVDVLNRSFACAPEDADRACRALFRAFPGVHRIHLDVMFPPEQLAFPRRIVERLEHMVIDLPASVDEYYGSLSKSTRRHLRSYRNRVRREFPDLQTETIDPGERSQALVDRLIEWKIQRFREQDRITYWETNPALTRQTAALLRRRGQCRITYIDGKEAVIHLCFPVGDTVFPLEGAHDPAYDAYHLGFLAMYETVCAAIESGARRVNLLERHGRDEGAAGSSAGALDLPGGVPLPAQPAAVARRVVQGPAPPLPVRLLRARAQGEAVSRWRSAGALREAPAAGEVGAVTPRLSAPEAA